MRTFGKHGNCKIPQSVDEQMAPLDLLYWAIYACLKSHAKDIDPEAELECGMYIGDNMLEIYVPVHCSEVMIKACKECYILRLLSGETRSDFTYRVNTDDKRFQALIKN